VENPVGNLPKALIRRKGKPPKDPTFPGILALLMGQNPLNKPTECTKFLEMFVDDGS